MAEVAAVELINIRTLSDGTDTYPDLRGFSMQATGNRFYNYRPENSTDVSRQTRIGSDQAPYSGQFTGTTISHEALANTDVATLTFAGTDAVGGGNKTVTLTGVKFGACSFGGGQDGPGPSSLSFTCTGYSIA